VETENLLRVRNILPRISNLSQINPAHSVPSHFFKIQLNINLSSAVRASKWFPSFRVYNQYLSCISVLPHECYMPTHLIISDFINLIIFGEKYKCTAHSEVIHTVSNITQNVCIIYSYFRLKLNYNYSKILLCSEK